MASGPARSRRHRPGGSGAHSRGRHGPRFDRLAVVTCRPEKGVERWADRLRWTEETARREVARRMGAQPPDEEKMKAADFVIDNSVTDETSRQVKKIYLS